MAMLEKHYSHIVMRKFAHRIAGDAKTTLHKRKALVSAACATDFIGKTLCGAFGCGTHGVVQARA